MYRYENERPRLFTELHIGTLLQVYEAVRKQPALFKTKDAIHGAAGDTWVMLAALDYLAERGMISKVRDGGVEAVWERHRETLC